VRKLLTIEGMACGHCAMKVQSALAGVPGVASVEVSVERKTAMIEGESLDNAALAIAVRQAGYRATSFKGGRQAPGRKTP
jgi:copper chaperone CopZ